MFVRPQQSMLDWHPIRGADRGEQKHAQILFSLARARRELLDNIGSEVPDLASAHAKAVKLAERVAAYGGFAALSPDLKRWTVQVVEQTSGPAMTVVFPTHFGLEKRPRGQSNGARLLIALLATRLLREGIVSRVGIFCAGIALVV
jgi:hypothetical protein